jgi:hypothetical protein
MTQSYADLLAIAGREPLWWDEVGVPRFVPFEPSLCNNIYAEEAALLLIECAACHRRLKVAVTWDHIHKSFRGLTSLSDQIERGTIHYGDAPCWRLGESQCAGTTMNSNPLRVVEYWKRCFGTWMRNSALEIAIDDVCEISSGKDVE